MRNSIIKAIAIILSLWGLAQISWASPPVGKRKYIIDKHTRTQQVEIVPLQKSIDKPSKYKVFYDPLPPTVTRQKKKPQQLKSVSPKVKYAAPYVPLGQSNIKGRTAQPRRKFKTFYYDVTSIEDFESLDYKQRIEDTVEDERL